MTLLNILLKNRHPALGCGGGRSPGFCGLACQAARAS
jgi:hypothetical protein